MARHRLLISCCALLLATTAAAAEIWRYKDANGNWQFTDRPVPGAEKVATPSRPAPRTDNATTQAATPAGGEGSDTASTTATSRRAAQQVKQDVAAVRAEHCRKAKENYEQAIAAVRLYKTDDKGNPQYLDADQMDAYRVAARTEMQQLCAK